MGEKILGEVKTALRVPEGYGPLLMDLRLLKSDGNNPNRMSLKQHEELWRSLLEHGWMSPIVVDEGLVFVDGERRAQVCLAHCEFFCSSLAA